MGILDGWYEVEEISDERDSKTNSSKNKKPKIEYRVQWKPELISLETLEEYASKALIESFFRGNKAEAVYEEGFSLTQDKKVLQPCDKGVYKIVGILSCVEPEEGPTCFEVKWADNWVPAKHVKNKLVKAWKNRVLEETN